MFETPQDLVAERRGAYRYTFNVDGATVLDYRNPSTSKSNANPDLVPQLLQ